MSTHEALEHAEHTHHAAHGGGFTTVVAMVMAIIAALLAVVTLLSHRSHNETLVCQTEAGVKHTQASDQWAFYQAKKIRKSEYEAYSKMLPLITKNSDDADAKKLVEEWQSQIKKYDSDAKDELKDIQSRALKLASEGEEQAKLSVAAHHRSDRYDLGELLVEIGLVLCSIAMLAKRKAFLVLAILSALLGAAIASTGYTGMFMHHDEAHGEHVVAVEGGKHDAPKHDEKAPEEHK